MHTSLLSSPSTPPVELQLPKPLPNMTGVLDAHGEIQGLSSCFPTPPTDFGVDFEALIYQNLKDSNQQYYHGLNHNDTQSWQQQPTYDFDNSISMGETNPATRGKVVKVASTRKSSTRGKQVQKKGGIQLADPPFVGRLSDLAPNHPDYDDNATERHVLRGSAVRKEEAGPEGRIKRPLNCFLLYRAHYNSVAKEVLRCLAMKQVKETAKARSQRGSKSGDFISHINPLVSKYVGKSWDNESPEVKTRFKQLSELDVSEHELAFPDYKFKPKKGGKKKGKGKGGSSSEDRDEEEETTNTATQEPASKPRRLTRSSDATWNRRAPRQTQSEIHAQAQSKPQARPEAQSIYLPTQTYQDLSQPPNYHQPPSYPLLSHQPLSHQHLSYQPLSFPLLSHQHLSYQQLPAQQPTPNFTQTNPYQDPQATYLEFHSGVPDGGQIDPALLTLDPRLCQPYQPNDSAMPIHEFEGLRNAGSLSTLAKGYPEEIGNDITAVPQDPSDGFIDHDQQHHWISV